jgi:hypothetical protein
MAKRDTRLSAAGYGLERVFLFIWRWRALRPYAGETGLAWGRRGAMRSARTFIRGQQDFQPSVGRPRSKTSEGQIGDLAPYGGVGEESYSQAPIEPHDERRRRNGS